MKKVLNFFTSKKNWTIVVLTIALMCPFALFDLPCDSLLTGKSADFKFSDLYARVADKAATSPYSNDVIVVAMDGCPRELIPAVIDTLNNKNVSVIGIDIIFKTKYDNDSLLVKSINRGTAKVVLAARLEEKNKETHQISVFKIVEKPYFDKLIKEPLLGAVNFSTYSVHGVVRSFKPSFYLGDEREQKSISHFSAEIVKHYSPKAFDILKRREDVEAEPIKFHQNDIDEFTWKEVLGGSNIDLDGKIAIIGYTGDINDLKSTPTMDEMPGVYIHAKTVQTILDGSYMTSSPDGWNKATALILAFFFIWVLLYLSKLPNIGNLIGRIVQIGLLLLIVMIGVDIFTNRNHYIDTFYIVLCIGLSQVCFDIINGIVYIYSQIKAK